MGDIAGKWLRVSTTGQSEANQEPDIDAHIDANGYEYGRTYTLHGKSASKGEQETTLRQAIADIEAGHITVIVAWALDRLDRRGVAESFRTKLRIEEAGGRVEFVKEPSMSELEYALKAYMAGEESKRRAERVRIGQDATRANDGVLQRAPWGYTITGAKRGKSFVPTTEGARYIPELFQRIANGESLAAVQGWLVSRGVKKSVPGIRGIIRNPVYQGFIQDRNGAVYARCEALVDSAVWKQANDGLSSKARLRKGRPAKAMLTGVITCGLCGAVVYRKHPERGEAGQIYACAGKPSCGSVRARIADDAVITLLDREVLDGPVFAWHVTPASDYCAEIQAVTYELSRLGLAGLDEETEDRKRAELRARRRDLESLPATPERREMVLTDKVLRETFPADSELRNIWLKELGFYVQVTKDKVTLFNAADDSWDMHIGK